MIEYDKNKPLFSLHIPKCAGTSFSNVIKRWFHLGYIRHYYNRKLDKDPVVSTRYKMVKKFLPVCVHGHFNEKKNLGVFDYYPDASQFITVVRDPLELQISLFNYVATNFKNGSLYRKGKKVENWNGEINNFINNSNSPILNHIPFTFSINNLADVIESNFVFISSLENLHRNMAELSTVLSKPMVKPPHINKSEFKYYPEEETINNFKERHEME